MLLTIRSLLKKTNNVSRSVYIWNAMSAMLAAAQCPVILMVMTRTNGLYDSGVFSIAFAVASLMLFMAQYGLRRFQSSDILEKYSFPEYHAMRLITCGAMMLASLGYCIYGMWFRDYGWEKFLIILLVCFLKCIQGYSDVIHGHMQLRGRLDVATKCSSVRYVAEMAALIVTLIITRNVLLSVIVCLVVSLIVMFLTSMNSGTEYCNTMVPGISGFKFRRLALEGFPLFASLFLNMYISNAPKYAIDAFLTEEMQAYYNLIFMPAFVVQLVTHFIFNPIITTYARLWESDDSGDRKELARRIRWQCFLIAGIMAAGVAVALTIGIPILSIIFGVDLHDLKMELVIIMIGGGMLAYATYFSTVITIIRLQKTLLFTYGAVALAAKLLAEFFVVNYSLMGAAVMYAALMTILSAMLFLILFWGIRRRAAEESAESVESAESAPVPVTSENEGEEHKL